MIFPRFRSFRRLSESISERMIREHGTWLSRVLDSGKRMPRIPVRKVSEGGFARMMARPTGRYRAERWWERTLERMEE